MGTPNSTPDASLPSSPQPAGTERSPEGAGTWAGTLFKGVVNLVTILLIIFLTYHFTVFFGTRAPVATPSTEAEKALAKKAEELRAQEHKIMSSYAWVNPAAKSVRIPVDRAMELIAAENAQPVVTAAPAGPSVAATPAPNPVVANAGAPKGVPLVPAAPTAVPTAPATVTTAAPAPATAPPAGAPTVSVATAAAPPASAPAPVGMAPDRIYFMVCMACHEADGRGSIARKSMKDAEQIPDLTDPKWQDAHKDAELEHSILEGKGKIMLARKDMLALAHTDVKDMVALMRSFRGGKQVITAAGAAQPLPAKVVSAAAGTGPSAPVSTAAAPATPVAQPTPLVPGPNSPTSTTGTTVAVAPAPPTLQPGSTNPAPAAPVSGPSAPPSVSPGIATAPAVPTQNNTGPGITLPVVLPVSTAMSPARAAKLRVASEFYRTNCFACHGLDGTGNLVRPLMPTIPNFTTREWQTSRSSTQLQTTILEGKGTNMPPWRGKFSTEFAGDLISYVRTFGPADLLTAGLTKTAAATNFDNQIRALKQQWDDVEKQLRELNLPPARP